MHAAHQAGEVLEVGLLELLEGLALNGREHLVAARAGVSADILVVHIVRGDSQDEGHRICAAHHQAGVRRGQRSLFRDGHNVRLETHSVALHLGYEVKYPGRKIAPRAVHLKAVAARGYLPPEGAREPGLQVHLAGLVGGYLHHHHVVRI